MSITIPKEDIAREVFRNARRESPEIMGITVYDAFGKVISTYTEPPTKIACACIIDSMGREWWGMRHSDCIALASRFGAVTKKDHAKKQGFKTEKGTYVTRTEAADIAFKAGQIPKPAIELHPKDPDLYSEDLY